MKIAILVLLTGDLFGAFFRPMRLASRISWRFEQAYEIAEVFGKPLGEAGDIRLRWWSRIVQEEPAVIIGGRQL